MQSWIHVIEWRANVRPELTALVDDRGAAYTYAQLRAEVEHKAGGWAGLGVGVGAAGRVTWWRSSPRTAPISSCTPSR